MANWTCGCLSSWYLSPPARWTGVPVTGGAEGVWREDEEGFKSMGHPCGGVHVASGEKSGPEASAHGHGGPGAR